VGVPKGSTVSEAGLPKSPDRVIIEIFPHSRGASREGDTLEREA